MIRSTLTRISLWQYFSTSRVLSVLVGSNSVLLRSGADAYIVIGIAAFAAGVALTLLCLRLARRGRPK